MKIYIIAGESSGDLLASHIMHALNAQSTQPLSFHGVGGEAMQEAGLDTSLFPMSDVSVMGFLEVLPAIPRVLNRINRVVNDIIQKQPDVIITVDAPDFSTRIIKKLPASLKAKKVHVVAPSVWAYRENRAQKFAKLYDHLLCLLPFEPSYFTKVGLSASFMGHPVVEQSSGPAFEEASRVLGYDVKNPVFLMLPGSRMGEVKRLMPIYFNVMKHIHARLPHAHFAVIAPKHVMPYLKEFKHDKLGFFSLDDKQSLFSRSNVALAKSGTVTLELAQAQVPMVVTYKVSALSAYLARRWLKVKYVTLVNILLNREAIPEYLQESATPEVLSTALVHLHDNKHLQDKQKAAMQEALSMLTPKGDSPANKAAHDILALMRRAT